MANSVGWKEVTNSCKKFLKQLPLTPHNLATTAEVALSLRSPLLRRHRSALQVLYKAHGAEEEDYGVPMPSTLLHGCGGGIVLRALLPECNGRFMLSRVLHAHTGGE